tara:strand:- start:1269 stop:3023 length:1755 start_codon:yes stop_codon:yes gene_type:complete
MSATKLSSSGSKILILLSFSIFLGLNLNAVESVDIWKENKQKNNDSQKQENNQEEKPKINFLKKEIDPDQIEITNKDLSLENEIKLAGLYDPEENDLSLEMWNGTNGQLIKDSLKRIEKIKLSKFSEEIFLNTILTYSYSPQKNLSEKEFLKLKINWLIKNNKIEIIENFLNKNSEFEGKSRLIKFLVDYYIASADILEGCKKSNFINKEIKDNYLEKFRIYCLVLNKKNEEAILNFDLLREEGRSDKFFNDKISFLLGMNEKPDNKISDKNLLNFYLSSITIEGFKYEPTNKTDKNIWKYLVASNLIIIEKLEDSETIKKYEVAANDGSFDKDKIFEIYMSIPFSINQLLNATTIYQGLEGYEGRALIYQRALLSDNIENQLKLFFLLKDSFDKEKLNNIFREKLSDTLKEIDPEKIPEDLQKTVEKNIIEEKNITLGKIKYDDKILHRSKLVRIFTEVKLNKEKINKDFSNVYKKIKRNKKYFYSIKDIMLLEALIADGITLPAEIDLNSLSRDLNVPSSMSTLIDEGQVGLFMLKLVEIIGSDEIENLDPETLYFISNLLNKGKIKKVRNQILNLALPLRV